MGLEAKCQLQVDGAVHEGQALLETDDLLFRGGGEGEKDVRLKIPLTSIRTVSASDGALQVDHDAGFAVFTLGSAAEKWADRIRSPVSLIDKLEVKPSAVVSLLGIADEAFIAQLQTRARRVIAGRIDAATTLILLAVGSTRDLKQIGKIAGAMSRAAALWVIHPKGPPPDGVRDTDVFAAAKGAGLAPTKVARFSGTHTAEKLVVPLAKRSEIGVRHPDRMKGTLPFMKGSVPFRP